MEVRSPARLAAAAAGVLVTRPPNLEQFCPGKKLHIFEILLLDFAFQILILEVLLQISTGNFSRAVVLQ